MFSCWMILDVTTGVQLYSVTQSLMQYVLCHLCAQVKCNVTMM